MTLSLSSEGRRENRDKTAYRSLIAIKTLGSAKNVIIISVWTIKIAEL